MSLLPSHMRRAELVRSVSGWRGTAIGCCLLVLGSCSFDSAPRAAERTSAVTEVGSDAALASDTGSARSADGAALEQDDAGGPTGPTDAGKRRTTPPTMVMTREGSMAAAEDPKDAGSKRDAGEPAKPNAGGGGAPAPVDAGTARDAGRTMQPTEPDPHCKEGVYAGTFSGSIQLIGLSLSTVTGTVRTELRLNPAGTYLEIRNARAMGVDQDGNTLTVDLSGNINCTSNAFEDGTLTNGVFHNVASNSDTLFTGEAQAMYSDAPHSVVGTFTVTAEGLVPLLTGRGTWSLIIND
jgi:hypothetical protein